MGGQPNLAKFAVSKDVWNYPDLTGGVTFPMFRPKHPVDSASTRPGFAG
jgi:hypothetical protein